VRLDLFSFCFLYKFLKEYENSPLIFTKIEHITVLSYEISWNTYANIRKANTKTNTNTKKKYDNDKF